MATGTVKWFNDSKGYGFIVPDNGSADVLLHVIDASSSGWEEQRLVVDEVLAVGDAAFQRQCLSRMGEAAREGRTVLFVSHNLEALRAICTTGLLLEAGRVKASGPVTEVIAPKLYRIDPVTGLASVVGATQFSLGAVTGVNGTYYAFDDGRGMRRRRRRTPTNLLASVLHKGLPGHRFSFGSGSRCGRLR